MSVAGFFKSIIHKNKAAPTVAHNKLELIEPQGYSLLYAKNTFYRYLFESGDELELSIPEKLVVEVAINNLKRKEQRILAVPRLPSVIPKLLRSLRDPNSSAKDYVSIINKDPVMSAAVLKLANSVYFSPEGAHIDEIDRAVVKLGIQGLRSVLSAAVMQPIIQRESPYFSKTGQKLWAHSLNCAVACEIVGQHRKMDRYKVYLMGLVHDIGKITLFSELCKQFKLNGISESPGHSAFAPSMKKVSAHLSYLIAKDWELPEDICEALRLQVGLHRDCELTPYGQLLYQCNFAAELYAVTARSKRSNLNSVITTFHLPHDIWDTLDKVDTQI